ncbi:MAG: hypothetical protein M0R39_11450 [Prolixibacteraceae bacterium]|jgi:hypothetical protein|nr:hypothetical protein [Prolixibacteraceae bacterium]
MKKSALTIIVLLLTLVILVGQTRKERKAMYDSQYNYELACLGVGNDGTKLLKVWGYGKKVDNAIYDAKRTSVAAVIFRGIPAGNGAAPTPSLLPVDGYEQHMDFFDEFFKDGGMYLSFVNLTTDGTPGGSDNIKMSHGYKVAVSASINFNELRKYLQDKGIIKRLDAGF